MAATVQAPGLQLEAFPNSIFFATVAGLTLSVAFVGAVYLVPSPQPRARNAPVTVWRRMLGVSLATAGAIGLLHHATRPLPASASVWQALGLAGSAAFHLHQSLWTLGLFALLFAGPILQECIDGSWSRRPSLRSIIFYRNYVVAPITEELVFRCCLVPLLQPVLGYRLTAWLAPYFFGTAHLHHLLDGQPPQLVVGMFAYTTVFGWLAAAVFMTTRSAWATIACHAFCNFMELPDFAAALYHRRRHLLIPVYVVGLLGFVVLGWRTVSLEGLR